MVKMDTNFVEDLLQKVEESEVKSNQLVKVQKQIDLFFDLRHLLAVDSNEINAKDFRHNKELYLRELARDDTQLIINKLWELETKTVDNAVVAELPEEHYLLPRSKPVPKPKAPTKWETYAKMKGIQKTKREKLVFDEESKEWKPRFGFRGINQNNDWVIEVPNDSDPNINYFEKKREDKKERVAKNELQRLRNIARSQRLKIGGNSGVIPQLDQSREQLKKASVLAKKSTASVGRFTESVAQEKAPKDSGKKRKFESNFGDINKEKDKSLKIIENLMNKKPKLDINKAIEPMVKNRANRANKAKPDFKHKSRHNSGPKGKGRPNGKSAGPKGMGNPNGRTAGPKGMGRPNGRTPGAPSSGGTKPNHKQTKSKPSHKTMKKSNKKRK